jgi:hypothetical protein
MRIYADPDPQHCHMAPIIDNEINYKMILMKCFLPKFFYKGFNDSFCCSCAGHPNALRGHLKRKQSST